jgi:hypothetical protein
MDKEKIAEKQLEIIGLTNTFCTEILKDKEYAQLAEKLVKKMGRKRNVPFETGKAEIWAAAVIHALGSINFLFDKSFQPYTTIDEINKFFDTKKTTTGTKSKFIRDLFKLGYWDSEFSTERMFDNNPFAGLMMSANGFIVPATSL